MSSIRKNKYRLLNAAAVIAVMVIVVIWRPPFLQTLFGWQQEIVRIPEQDFVPADSNRVLLASQARLLVVTDFHATKLLNDRSIHIYLPPGYYKDTDKRYPVLYVHDGKSVFEQSDWSKESLNMHTQADALISQGKIRELIIVGIDNIGDNRIAEYALWDGVEQGAPVHGLGQYHEDFILNDVKPFIDRNFRTLSDRENTALMGESIGGFSAFNTGFRHPEVFSKLAMQSPYLGWGDGKLYGMLSDGPYKEKLPFKIWIDVGATEGSFVDMAAQGINLLMQNGYRYGEDLFAYEAPGGAHSDKYWGERVESILLYFYGSIGKPESVKLHMENSISLSDQTVRHINPVVTYDSGFMMTELAGSYSVRKPELFEFTGFGAMLPKAEGTTEITFTTSTGLTATETLTVTK
jgi:enterochelin esterase-like enzyme